MSFKRDFSSSLLAEQDLKKNYDNIAHPVSFAGISAVQRWYNYVVSASKIRRILATFESYTLHKELRSGLRNPFFIYLPRWRMEIDLLDVGRLAEYNNGIKFIVMLVDCWTRKLWVEPVKRKTADQVLNAVKKIFARIGKTPKYLGSDRGLEFTNKKMQKYCKKMKVKFTPNYNYIHSAFVERANRTFQKILYAWMTENETRSYFKKLKKLVLLYNMRYNRVIKMSPRQAEKERNHVQLRKNMELHYNAVSNRYRRIPYFKVNDVVRIAKSKSTFHRSYDEQMQQELFKIVKVNTRLPIPTYTLTNFEGTETIMGNFYEFELTLVRNEDNVYRIERVLKTRVVKGKIQNFVRWKGFSPKFDQWIDADAVTREFV